jgi:hypothetical protein
MSCSEKRGEPGHQANDAEKAHAPVALSNKTGTAAAAAFRMRRRIVCLDTAAKSEMILS